MARFLTDEHAKGDFIDFLRDRGHTVERSRDRLGQGASDARLAELANEEAAIVVTANQGDFDRIVRRDKGDRYPQAGCLFLTTVSYALWRRRLEQVMDVFDYELERSVREGGRFYFLVGRNMVQIFR